MGPAAARRNFATLGDKNSPASVTDRTPREEESADDFACLVQACEFSGYLDALDVTHAALRRQTWN